MKIGFSNGACYRLFQSFEQRYEQNYLDSLNLSGQAQCLELHCHDEEDLDYLCASKDINLSNFNYLSLHTPPLAYADNEASHRTFAKFQQLAKRFSIRNFVFHTDTVLDWSVFLKYPDLPISIENMDDRKPFGRTLEDVQSILSKYNFGLTLDLQHCFVNDPSMNLATQFQNVFGNRIVQYHLSGYDQDLLHYPLYKTKQNEIISALRFPNIPIIIESTFDAHGEQQKEFEYITAATTPFTRP